MTQRTKTKERNVSEKERVNKLMGKNINEKRFDRFKVPVGVSGLGTEALNQLNKIQERMGKASVGYNLISRLKHGEMSWETIKRIAATTSNHELAINMVKVFEACNRDQEITYVMVWNPDSKVQRTCDNSLEVLAKRFYERDGKGFENGHEPIVALRKLAKKYQNREPT